MKNKGFSLIELLVVIVLIAIISIVAFISFGNQSSKARNSIRLDNSSKILKAFQLQQLDEKIPSTSCLSGSSPYSLTGTLSGTGCNVVLDGSQEAKSFLNNLKISGSFQDPANGKVLNGDLFQYEFNYKLGDNQYEFAYLMEPKEEGSLININKSYALEYQSGSLNSLNVNGNYPSVDKMISPIIFKDNNGQNLFSNLYSTGLTANGKIKVTRFEKTEEYKNKLQGFVNSSNSSSNDNTGNVDNQYSLISTLPDFVQIDKDYFTQITLNNGNGGKYSELNVISENNELKNGFTLYYKENGQYKNLFSHPNIVDVNISPGFVFANNQLGIMFRFEPVLSSPLDIYYKISEIENLTQDIEETPSNGISFHLNQTPIKFEKIGGVPYLSNGNLVNWTYLNIDDYYTYTGNGGNIMKVNLQTSELESLTVPTGRNSSWGITIDSTHIYSCSNGGGLTKMKKDGTEGILLNSISCYRITNQGDFLYFFANNNLYKLNKDGTGLEVLYSRITTDWDLTSDLNYLYFSYGGDGHKLYRIDLNGQNLIKLNDIFVKYLAVTDNYIFVTSTDEFIYRIDKDGTNKILFSDFKQTSGGWLARKGNYVYFKNYRMNESIREGFMKTDNIIVNEINNTNTGIYINVNSTAPAGTDYKFYLGNKNTETTILPEGGDTFLMGNGIDNVMGPMDGYGLQVGDEIILYKTGESDIIATISQISWDFLRFTENTGKSGMGWGIKKGSANFKEIPKSKLDGNTLINLETEFGEQTNSLWYKVELIGDSTDSTKTPIINSINFLK